MDRSIKVLWLNRTPAEFVVAMTTGAAIPGKAFLCEHTHHDGPWFAI